jgi:hypothetical protein
MNNTIKIAILLMASAGWIEILCILLPEMAVYGGYLVVAIYFRFRYFRNSQIEHLLYRDICVLEPEVIHEC